MAETAPGTPPTPPTIAPHNFEKVHFSSPRWCDTCGEFIWGLGKQGYRCITCNYACHGKCRNGADACGQMRQKNANKGKGLSLAATPGGPPYVHTLPNYSGFLTKEEHPLFTSLEGKDFVRIVQLGGKGSLVGAITQTAALVNTVGALAEGEFGEDEEEEGGEEEEGEKKGKGPKVQYQYEAYYENWSTKVFHITALIQKPKKVKIMFKKGQKKSKAEKDKKKQEAPHDPTKPKEKKKKSGLISITFKKMKYSVAVGGKHIADIRKHPHEGAFKHHYIVQNPQGTTIFDATASAVAEFSATYKIAPPGSPEKIGKITRVFKAVHLYKDGCNVYKILFPKYCSLDVKAMMLALTMVLDVEEYAAKGSVLTRSSDALAAPISLVGAVAKISGGGE
eukprot:TRINITY_DN16392_c0_g1_i1.p1 TRINITY_DN16392_c0_g1~~TRINITY_DN16392_c0_g1_i1.p1  ORF type:complete len:393 (-),score=115.30 TRINITY_DN16392_c0_g1_i1:185-1363(-)